MNFLKPTAKRIDEHATYIFDCYTAYDSDAFIKLIAGTNVSTRLSVPISRNGSHVVMSQETDNLFVLLHKVGFRLKTK